MKVYIVIRTDLALSSDQSDSEVIEKVFLNESNAQEYVAKHDDKFSPHRYETLEVCDAGQ
jgi:hypothetical protein